MTAIMMAPTIAETSTCYCSSLGDQMNCNTKELYSSTNLTIQTQLKEVVYPAVCMQVTQLLVEENKDCGDKVD